MNILIIGNGFDLAHGLPTSYVDFLKFFHSIDAMPLFSGDQSSYKKHLAQVYPKSPSIQNTLSNIFRSINPFPSIDSFKPVFEDITAQKIYENLKRNIWYHYFYTLYKNGQMKGINWIDFESELSHIIEIFDRTEEKLYKEFVKDAVRNTYPNDEKIGVFLSIVDKFKFLNDSSTFTYRDFLNNSYSQLRSFIYCMELYLQICIENCPITLLSPDIRTINPNAVLCFNYTHTFVTKYGSLFPNVKVHYIHGETKDADTVDTSNMVLGINEYYKDTSDCNSHTNYNIYKKFTQRVINETGFQSREWLHTMNVFEAAYKKTNNQFPSNVYVFGHSLDITDKDILKDFIDRDGVKTTIFYYDKQQQTQQIANLVKMLGQEHFIKMINNVPQQITFIKQQGMIDAS